MTDWQDISTAPKDGTLVILGTTLSWGTGRVLFDWFFEDGKWGDWEEVDEDVLVAGERISHWMPAIQPPEAQE